MPNKNYFKTHEEYLEWYRKYRREHKDRISEINKKCRKKTGYDKKWYRGHLVKN